MYFYRYVEVMGLEEPTDNIGTVLTKSAVKLGKTKRLRNVDGGSSWRPVLADVAFIWKDCCVKWDRNNNQNNSI
jgi:hypothetical protein